VNSLAKRYDTRGCQDACLYAYTVNDVIAAKLEHPFMDFLILFRGESGDITGYGGLNVKKIYELY
jgi:hypothetical protein